MSQNQSSHVDSIVTNPGYKTYQGFRYHLNFPNEWILNEDEDTGRACPNCVGADNVAGFAMWRGIILGYCSNCAFTYDGSRGPGFYCHAVEFIRPKNNDDIVESVFNTYLKDIDLDNTGDIFENPEDTMENHYDLKEGIVEICSEYYKFVEEMEEMEEQQEKEENEYSDF